MLAWCWQLLHHVLASLHLLTCCCLLSQLKHLLPFSEYKKKFHTYDEIETILFKGRFIFQLKAVHRVRDCIVENLYSQGYLSPTPVQMQVWPLMLEGRDLLAAAPTGSGEQAMPQIRCGGAITPCTLMFWSSLNWDTIKPSCSHIDFYKYP